MSVIFNNLRKDILGENLTRYCDTNTAEIFEKQKNIYDLSKRRPTIRYPESRIKREISDLSDQIVMLKSNRDNYLNVLANDKSNEYFLSPNNNNDKGKFLCNFEKSGLYSGLNTDTVLTSINKDYNIIRLAKNILGPVYYQKCLAQDLTPYEKNIISIQKGVSIQNVSKLCLNLRTRVGDRDISDNLRSSVFWYKMYPGQDSVYIELDRLFREDIALREEIITNVKKFIDNEFQYWRSLVSGWKKRNEPWSETISVQGLKRKASQYIYGDLTNFTQLTKYLAEHSNDPKYISLYDEIRAIRPIVSSNITILNPSWQFYSAYPDDFSSDEFANKNYIWLTPEIAQSLLYILGDKPVMQPIIFKFKFKRPLILLNPQNQDNKDIADMFLTLDANFSRKFAKINNILGDLTGGSNSKILYFIDVINKHINDENYRIDGYRNRQDQNEIAVVDLSSVIDRGSIVKGIFEKIVIANPGVIPNEVTFPLIVRKKFNVTGFQSGTWNEPPESRASCPYDMPIEYRDARGRLISSTILRKALYTLYYRWQDESTSKTFRCLENVTDDAPEFVNDV